MRLLGLFVLGAIILQFALIGWAQDLSTIPRQIHKHPKYQSSQPKFGLLVLGAKAEVRVWVVIDGDVLYLDRNGNGDLTEPGERFELEVTHFTKEIRDDAKTLKSIMLSDPKQRPDQAKDDQPILSCEPRVTWFHVFHLVPREGSYQEKRWTKDSFDLTIFANGCNEFARAEFGDSPEEAALIAFMGRRTFKLDQDEQPILRRGQDNSLTVAIYCEGFRSKTVIDHNFVPESIHPVVEIECLSSDPHRPPIRVRAELTERC